jgi:hypothetical protein
VAVQKQMKTAVCQPTTIAKTIELLSPSSGATLKANIVDFINVGVTPCRVWH